MEALASRRPRLSSIASQSGGGGRGGRGGGGGGGEHKGGGDGTRSILCVPVPAFQSREVEGGGGSALGKRGRKKRVIVGVLHLVRDPGASGDFSKANEETVEDLAIQVGCAVQHCAGRMRTMDVLCEKDGALTESERLAQELQESLQSAHREEELLRSRAERGAALLHSCSSLNMVPDLPSLFSAVSISLCSLFGCR
jgi:hypothetical protein